MKNAKKKEFIVLQTINDAPKYMKTVDAADYIGVSRSTIYKWYDQGLPRYKLGGVVICKREDLENFANAIIEPDNEAAQKKMNEEKATQHLSENNLEGVQ